MITELKQYLIQNGKTHTWLELANMFNILPNGTNKQKSDFVRKYFKRNIETSFPGIKGQSFKVVLDRDMFKETVVNPEFEEFLKWKQEQQLKDLPQPYLNGDPKNVLVIGDLHEPFCLEDYLYFCRAQQEKFNCGTVVFIGDIIDNHFSSYHDTDPDGLSAGMELVNAIKKVQRWYKVFPEAIVTVGNHDRMVARKLFSGQLSQRWIRPIQEVLEVPNWNFVDEFIHNDVLYIHGEGGTAKTKAREEMISVVQGHLHSEGYTEIISGTGGQRFAMQVGCGIDFKQYAFSYAQRGKKPVISCGIVLNNFPILIPHGS